MAAVVLCNRRCCNLCHRHLLLMLLLSDVRGSKSHESFWGNCDELCLDVWLESNHLRLPGIQYTVYSRISAFFTWRIAVCIFRST